MGRNLDSKGVQLPLRAALLAGAVGLAGCSNDVANVLAPEGFAAREIGEHWWLLFWLGTAVYVLVLAYMMIALFRRRGQQRPPEEEERRGNRVIVWAGIVLPLIVLFIVFGGSIRTLRALSTPEIEAENVVHVTGRQWWWEVAYPSHQFETANEVHIAVGVPVQIVLESEDVIHSFWIPSLHGKLDTMPGATTRFWIQADTPGEYRGICAEFCGIQHAHMAFVVVAQPAEEYQAWLDAQRVPASAPATDQEDLGAQVFMEAGCLECHAIRGTDATGNLGPDLTHLASRPMLGALTIENNRGNLAGWIADPQHIKPGVYMPATDLTGEELNALLAYLESLE